MYLEYGGRVTGPARYVSPAIAALYTRAALMAGHWCWQADDPDANVRAIVHRSRSLQHWTWMLPHIGILSTVLGSFLALTSGNRGQELVSSVLTGAGVGMAGTFVGVYGAVFIKAYLRILQHELEAER